MGFLGFGLRVCRVWFSVSHAIPAIAAGDEHIDHYYVH